MWSLSGNGAEKVSHYNEKDTSLKWYKLLIRMKSIGHFCDKVKDQEWVSYILRMFLLFMIMMHETFIILIETNVIFTRHYID